MTKFSKSIFHNNQTQTDLKFIGLPANIVSIVVADADTPFTDTRHE